MAHFFIKIITWILQLPFRWWKSIINQRLYTVASQLAPIPNSRSLTGEWVATQLINRLKKPGRETPLIVESPPQDQMTYQISDPENRILLPSDVFRGLSVSTVALAAYQVVKWSLYRDNRFWGKGIDWIKHAAKEAVKAFLILMGLGVVYALLFPDQPQHPVFMGLALLMFLSALWAFMLILAKYALPVFRSFYLVSETMRHIRQEHLLKPKEQWQAQELLTLLVLDFLNRDTKFLE